MEYAVSSALEGVDGNGQVSIAPNLPRQKKSRAEQYTRTANRNATSLPCRINSYTCCAARHFLEAGDDELTRRAPVSLDGRAGIVPTPNRSPNESWLFPAAFGQAKNSLYIYIHHMRVVKITRLSNAPRSACTNMKHVQDRGGGHLRCFDFICLRAEHYIYLCRWRVYRCGCAPNVPAVFLTLAADERGPVPRVQAGLPAPGRSAVGFYRLRLRLPSGHWRRPDWSRAPQAAASGNL